MTEPRNYQRDGENLLKAVKDANLDEVKRLLDEGASPNFIYNGERPLILAAKLKPLTLDHEGKGAMRQVNIVRELIRRGVDLNATDGDGNTAVYKATIMGNIPILNILLNAGANPNAGRAAPITEAVNSPRVVALLLSKDANINGVGVTGVTFLDDAIRVGNPEVIKMVYDHAVSKGNTAVAVRLRREITWNRRSHALAAVGLIRGGRRRKTKRVQRRAHKSRRNK